MESMAAEAKPSRAVDPQNAAHQRRQRRRFENLVGDEGDALRNLFFPQRKQGGLGETQPVQLFAAGGQFLTWASTWRCSESGSSLRK